MGRCERVDIRDDVVDGTFVRQGSRGCAHLRTLLVLRLISPLTRAEVFELSHEIPVALSGQRRCLHRALPLAVRTMTRDTGFVQLLAAQGVTTDCGNRRLGLDTR